MEELHKVSTFPGVSQICRSNNGVQLAQALVEHETLDKSEVERVIRGEKIRQVEEKLKGATPATPGTDARRADSKPTRASPRPQPAAAV